MSTSSFTVEDALDREVLNDVGEKLAAFNAAIAKAIARKFECAIGNEPQQGQSIGFLNFSQKIDVITGDLRVVATKRHGIAAPTTPNEKDKAKN